MPVRTERRGNIYVVTLDRPEAKNAVDGPTADEIHAAFLEFEADGKLSVAVLHGANGIFCAGADLKSIGTDRQPKLTAEGNAPMGFSRLTLSKPVIGAVEGYAVAGGFELAMWCDLRVAAKDAVFGIFCRRWGVPLLDGGTIRLTRMIGMSRAMDLILTGRGVSGEEALQMGVANRIVEKGKALEAALELAGQLTAFPQQCMRSDRLAIIENIGLPLDEAHANEFRRGMNVINSGETLAGAQKFAGGAGRHGSFSEFTKK
ncbi:MAG: crotonase/enoyl-CoA hydratase family protein [Myxococcaceae bacterium]